MAGVPIEIDDRLTEALNRALAAAEDLSVPMSEIAGYGEMSTKLRFRDQKAPDGTPWTPSKRARDEGGLTLVLSGDLRSSIGSESGSDFAEWGPERSFGAAVYAAIHQWGGTIRPRGKAAGGSDALRTPAGPRAAVTLSARPYLGLSAEDRDEIGDVLIRHLNTAFGASA
jgi:phage virion morphogenesis protein